MTKNCSLSVLYLYYANIGDIYEYYRMKYNDFNLFIFSLSARRAFSEIASPIQTQFPLRY